MPGKARDGKELLPALSKAARKYTRRKNLPTITGDPWIQKDPLEEEEMATHSSILTWEIPWTEEPGGLQFKGSQELGMT